MCKPHGANVDAIPECTPDLWSYDPAHPAKSLGKMADICWNLFSSLFDNCGFTGAAHVKSSVWSGFYIPAIMHDDKSQRTRLEFIVNEYIDVTVINLEARVLNKAICYKNALLEDFVDDETLPDKEAETAARRLAGRLVNLMKKLGQKHIDYGEPLSLV